MNQRVLMSAAVFVVSVTGPLSGTSSAQAPAEDRVSLAAPEAAGQAGGRASSSDWPQYGVGFRIGTLGIGAQGGVRFTDRLTVRGGFSAFTYSDTFSKDNANYTGSLQLRSVDVKLDVGLLGGFRFTPGLLLYNGNGGTATLAVAGGKSFTLGGVPYYSSNVTGNATLSLNTVAPTLGFGFGSLVPGSRHWSVMVDFGTVFQGSPQFTLALAGNACAANFTNCVPINSLPGVQANIQSEQDKVTKDLKPFKFYPELAIGFGYKF